MSTPYTYSQEVPSVVPVTSVLPQICVSPPYFALEQLSYDGKLQARVNASQPQTREAGPMRAAELSRHGAISGLVCAALNQETTEHRYYLATSAHYRAFRNDAPYGSDVQLEAGLTKRSNRYAKAHIELCNDAPVAELDVTYSVLKSRLFDKLFAAHRNDAVQPSVLTPLPEGILTREGNGFKHHFSNLPVECCAGHFENYPALPVALIVAEMGRLSELILGTDTFVHDAKVRADRLCWAGNPLTFRTELRSSEGDLHRFYGEAVSGGEVCTQLDFLVEAL